MIRRARLTDIEAIEEVTQTAYAKWPPLIGRKPKPMAADHGKAVSEHMVNVFKTDNRVVAIVEVIPNSQFLLIENLAVSPAEPG